jgi:hypothetical protein
MVIVLLPFAIAGLALALFPPCWAWVSMLDMRSWSLQVWFGVVVALGIVLLWMRSCPKKPG